MSSLTQLLSFFGRVPGDELWLTIGERPYIVHGGQKTPLGSHPMSAGLVFAAASELVPIEELRSLPTDRARVVRHQHDGGAWVVEIVRAKSGISLCIRRSKGADVAARPALHARPESSGAVLEDAVDVEVDVDVDIGPSVPVGNRDSVAPLPALASDGRTSGPDRGSLRSALLRAVALGVSDLHLSSAGAAFARIDGELRPARAVGIPPVDDLVAELRQMVPTPVVAGARALVHEVAGVARFRVAIHSELHGLGASIRVVPNEVPTLERLVLPRACLELCQLPAGLVLVAGPAGSGKSSTLAAMVNQVNRDRSEHIVTVEDPVEHVHPSLRSLVRHQAVGAEEGAFVAAMRSCLQQDANVVMLGALGDLPSVALALQMAESGHLVFAGIDTLTAVSAIERLVDMFPGDRQTYARLMISRALKGVVAQALCKRVAGGRVAAHEVLMSTPAVAALVREGKTFQVSGIMQASKALGMSTLNESLAGLVQRQLVTPKEAISRSVDKAGLVAMLNQLSRFSSSQRLRKVSAPVEVPERLARIR